MYVGIANPRSREKASQYSRRMRNQHFYVSVKRPMEARKPLLDEWPFQKRVSWLACSIFPTAISSRFLPFDIIRVTSHDRQGVSNHRQHGCMFNRLFRLISKKMAKSAWLFVRGIHRSPVDSLAMGPLRRKKRFTSWHHYVCSMLPVFTTCKHI